jgi:CHAT domain-containing protein
MPRLPSAAHEAATVAGFYEGSQLYLGERATRDVLLGSIGRARVVHFAGHAVVDERYPELSRLILASPSRDGPRHVLMRDLADLALPRTEIVVLAACETGVGSVFKGRGALSLASPFVSAGVPAVVSTLWPIDDRSAGRLFSIFQQHVAAGVEPMMAMRRAQQTVRDDPSLTPWSWAAASMFTTLTRH